MSSTPTISRAVWLAQAMRAASGSHGGLALAWSLGLLAAGVLAATVLYRRQAR